ncbi:MAG: M24 family metallopeptidase [Gaiellaceae bacterium]
MRELRRERLLELLERRSLDAIVLRRPANFAWYTGGADSRVDHVAPDGVADLVVTRDGECVVTSTIEAPRMRAEQTPELDVVEYAWERGPQQMLHLVTGGRDVGADVAMPGAIDLTEEVAGLRRTLDADAIEQLRAVGRDATEALAEAALAVAPGVTELELAGEIAAACRRRGLSAPVLLAAADARIASFRHALPFGAAIESRAMLVVSAERGGLYANLTRFVELEEPAPALARRIEAAREILERMRTEATVAGTTLAGAFAACRRFYADVGHPHEIRLHHQGGLTGYASREVIATPQTRHEIAVGQAFAWNPSITGAKAEETFVLTESKPEVVAGAMTLAA